DFEGATRPRRGLLEDQYDLLAFQMLLLGAGILGALEVAGQGEEILEFPLREILDCQERAVAQIEAHFDSPVGSCAVVNRPVRAKSGRSCNGRRRGPGPARRRAPGSLRSRRFAAGGLCWA